MSTDTAHAVQTSLLHYLQGLEHVLKQAQQHLQEKDVDDATVLELRLIADMAPLKFQVQLACELALRGTARLAGAEVPDPPRDQQTIAELLASLEAARHGVAQHAAGDLAAGIERQHEVPLGGNPVPMSGASYLYDFLLPNFFFHVTTAYATLRENGVPLGKRDYMAGVTFR